MDFALISLLIVSVYAQGPVCSTGNNIPAFQACARDSLVDSVGQVGPGDITSACGSLQNDQGAYYNCLCSRAAALVNCYSIFCPGDPILSSAKQSQSQFCEAAKLYPPPTTAVKNPTQASPTAIQSSTDKPKQNSGVIIQVVPAIITFIIGLLI